MAYALIGSQGKIVDFKDKPFAVPEGMNWVDLSKHDVKPGHLWDYKDGKFLAPKKLELSPAQKASEARIAGIKISGKNKSINGVYSIDHNFIANIVRDQIYLLVNNKFPGGVKIRVVVDKAGEVHEFSAEEWPKFMTAVVDYVASLEAIIEDDDGELPSSTVSLD